MNDFKLNNVVYLYESDQSQVLVTCDEEGIFEVWEKDTVFDTEPFSLGTTDDSEEAAQLAMDNITDPDFDDEERLLMSLEVIE